MEIIPINPARNSIAINNKDNTVKPLINFLIFYTIFYSEF